MFFGVTLSVRRVLVGGVYHHQRLVPVLLVEPSGGGRKRNADVGMSEWEGIPTISGGDGSEKWLLAAYL